MTDRISPVQRSRNMRAVKSSHTQPEMVVRRLIHGMGFRYRLHAKELPGRPDIVFRPRRKVVFVHGCFWHGHDGCSRGRRPASNVGFWNAKLDLNRRRDAAQREALRAGGWSVLVIWECETRHPARLRERLRSFLADDD